MNVSSSANSLAERWISTSPRHTCRVAGVEAQVADLDDRRPLGGAAPGERPQPREQLRERERLREVVVGARVEAGDPVLDGVPRGQHQHGAQTPLSRPAAADRPPSTPGQHQVEHDRVVLGRLRHPEGVVPRACDVDRVALLAQAAPQQPCHLHVVLDDQHAHARILPRR